MSLIHNYHNRQNIKNVHDPIAIHISRGKWAIAAGILGCFGLIESHINGKENIETINHTVADRIAMTFARTFVIPYGMSTATGEINDREYKKNTDGRPTDCANCPEVVHRQDTRLKTLRAR